MYPNNDEGEIFGDKGTEFDFVADFNAKRDHSEKEKDNDWEPDQEQDRPNLDSEPDQGQSDTISLAERAVNRLPKEDADLVRDAVMANKIRTDDPLFVLIYAMSNQVREAEAIKNEIKEEQEKAISRIKDTVRELEPEITKPVQRVINNAQYSIMENVIGKVKSELDRVDASTDKILSRQKQAIKNQKQEAVKEAESDLKAIMRDREAYLHAAIDREAGRLAKRIHRATNDGDRVYYRFFAWTMTVTTILAVGFFSFAFGAGIIEVNPEEWFNWVASTKASFQQ